MNNNLNNQAVPTSEEIESIYEDILRSEARSNEENDLKHLGEFYKRFRKKENKREESKSENSIIKEYRTYLKKEENKQKKLIEELENLISYEKFFLELERKRNQKYYNSNFYGSNEATRYRVDKINSYSKELREIINNSPDAWRYYYHRQLINDIKTGYNQNLIEVSYVIEAKRKIKESLKLNNNQYEKRFPKYRKSFFVQVERRTKWQKMKKQILKKYRQKNNHNIKSLMVFKKKDKRKDLCNTDIF